MVSVIIVAVDEESIPAANLAAVLDVLGRIVAGHTALADQLPGRAAMTRAQIRSFVRRDDRAFLDIAETVEHTGERFSLPGAASFTVDGVELFGPDLWDDVNWLWSLMVQVLADCRRPCPGSDEGQQEHEVLASWLAREV